MFIQNGKLGAFRTRINIFMASLGTEDIIWFLPAEQFFKDSICGTVLITTREMYTHQNKIT